MENYNDMKDPDELSPSSYIRPEKRYAPAGVHVPNKNEAALLRNIMSFSGLSEKEVREHKKYRYKF